MLPRFNHILVPLDFTPKNQAALDIAFEIAVQNEAKVTLLHVIETIDVDASNHDLDDFYSSLETRANTELESRSQRFLEAGISTDYKVRYGKRVLEVVQFADEHHVDLIVLSSHSVDPDQPLRGLGTLSYQVSYLCKMPVLLVK